LELRFVSFRRLLRDKFQTIRKKRLKQNWYATKNDNTILGRGKEGIQHQQSITTYGYNAGVSRQADASARVGRPADARRDGAAHRRAPPHTHPQAIAGAYVATLRVERLARRALWRAGVHAGLRSRVWCVHLLSWLEMCRHCNVFLLLGYFSCWGVPFFAWQVPGAPKEKCLFFKNLFCVFSPNICQQNN
jgi:hypothetical protein